MAKMVPSYKGKLLQKSEADTPHRSLFVSLQGFYDKILCELCDIDPPGNQDLGARNASTLKHTAEAYENSIEKLSDKIITIRQSNEVLRRKLAEWCPKLPSAPITTHQAHGHQLLELRNQLDLGVNDLTNPHQMKSVRQRLLDSKNILMAQQSSGFASKAHISCLEREVAELTNVILEKKRENRFMKQFSERLHVTKAILQVQNTEPHTKGLEEKLVTALGETIAKCKLSTLNGQDSVPKKSSVVISEKLPITNTNLQIDLPRNSPILTKLTRLIQANKVEQVIYQSVNYIQDRELLFAIFNSIKGIPCPYKAEQLSVRYLRQLLNTVALLNVECTHHADKIRLELPKTMVLDGVNLFVRAGEIELLKQWIIVNKCAVCVAVANQLINHTTSESGSRIKLSLYDMACFVFETIADEQVKAIKSSPFRSRSATTRSMDQMQERLTSCQLGAIQCCLMLNEPERALQMIQKWNVAHDQTISTGVPSEKLFNLLAKHPSASVAGRIVSQLLLDSKMNWPQIIQFVRDTTYRNTDRAVQNHAQKASPTSDMVVRLLAAILTVIMENIPLKDQAEEITRIVKRTGKQPLRFWSTLMESVPGKDSQQAAVTETCTHHTNACPDRTVYLVQLVTAALLELTDSAEEMTTHGHVD